MQLDIRMPIGALFTVLGIMLVAWGLIADDSINARSLGHDLNLWWGLVILVFGIVFLVLAQRGQATQRLAMDDPEGRETEEREKRLGLEN